MIDKAGLSCESARTGGAVTLVDGAHPCAPHPSGDLRSSRSAFLPIGQRFGSALNLNVHFHGPSLDGVYAERPDDSVRFPRVQVGRVFVERTGMALT